MTPEAALAKQIEMYRQMTGEQRLALALELHELPCDISREAFAINIPRRMQRKLNVSCIAVLNLVAQGLTVL